MPQATETMVVKPKKRTNKEASNDTLIVNGDKVEKKARKVKFREEYLLEHIPGRLKKLHAINEARKELNEKEESLQKSITSLLESVNAHVKGSFVIKHEDFPDVEIQVNAVVEEKRIKDVEKLAEEVGVATIVNNSSVNIDNLIKAMKRKKVKSDELIETESHSKIVELVMNG